MSDRWRVLDGDALQRLRGLPAGSVQCCVTSPPYFGLRDYGTGEWTGGDPACTHGPSDEQIRRAVMGASGLGERSASQEESARSRMTPREVCHCGAVRTDRQIGLEPTPDEYVAALVAVVAEVRRVLRDDGTLWLNIGDSYASTTSTNGGYSASSTLAGFSRPDTKGRVSNEAGERRPLRPGVKPKDLLGIPWQLAFALRADGWYLRSDVIWSKPNPMPESVTDRPTSAHEHVFLLTKRSRYFYDADAIREALAAKRVKSDNWGSSVDERQPKRHADGSIAGANKRNVWEIATAPYPDAHFATFPAKLVEPCVLAGTGPDDLVLDPFAGSGTVGVVCRWYGRAFVGVELNPVYADLARRRIEADGPLGRAAKRSSGDDPDQLELFQNAV